MAHIPGLSGNVAFVTGPAVTNVGGTTPNNAPPNSAKEFPAVIDGTPVRVVVIALSAAAGLTALRMAGFRFNVGVSAR